MRFFQISFILLIGCLTPAHATQAWLKGNLHVHTINSDGNSSPDVVARWYKEHGYQFVFVTDHNLRTPVEGLNNVYAAPDRFLVLPGIEVTDRVGNRPVHTVGLGVRTSLIPVGGDSVESTLEGNAKAVIKAGGVPFTAHPNGLISRALSAAEIGSANSASIFEMCCSDYRGGSGVPSTEELWDDMLTSGRKIYGVAADDAHNFRPDAPDPGSSWVMVRATALTQNAILAALRAGDFYASTGVELDDVTYNDGKLCIAISEKALFGYRTVFIGENGEVVHRDETMAPCADIGTHKYLRARVERSDGAYGWVQPVFRE